MAATFTVNLNLAKPATGDLDWGPEVDANFDIMDACGYANREDRYIRIFGGGELTYDATTGQIFFTEDITIHHGVSGFLSTIPASESPFVCSASYHLTYFIMTRNPQASETLTTTAGDIFRDELAVPSANGSFVFALRDATQPTNQIILFNGQILVDGEPGSMTQGSFLTLTQAYNNSQLGEIALASDSKYFRILSMAAPQDTPVQESLSPTAGEDFGPDPTGFAIQFQVTDIASISRLVARLGKVGNPPGNWFYQVVADNAGLPGSTPLFTGPLSLCNTLPTVAADQPLEGNPSALVQLNPGTYWFQVLVDNTYISGTTSGNTISMATSAASKVLLTATYNFLTTRWSNSSVNFYYQIYQEIQGDGAELFAVSQASGGLISVKSKAKFQTSGAVEMDLSYTGLEGISVASIVLANKIVLGTDQEILSINPGDSVALRLSPNSKNNGLYKVLTVQVDIPASGQSTITIDQTAALANLGYKTSLSVAESAQATVADILRASDTNYMASFYDELDDLFVQWDSFRHQMILNGALLISGTILNGSGPLSFQDVNTSGNVVPLTNSGSDYALFASTFGTGASLLGALGIAGAGASNGGGSPGALQAENPATSKLDILAGPFIQSTGVAVEFPAAGASVPSIPASSVDFQTQLATGATFSVIWPTGSTVGNFRRAAFSLLSDSTVQIQFSSEGATLEDCPSAATLFSAGTPLGWIDLECTATGPDVFKTAGSTSNIIENAPGGASAVHIFKTGGGGGGSGSGALFNVVQEPIGTGDGTTASFTSSQMPINASCALVMVNRGIVPTAGWTQSGNTFTFQPGFIPAKSQQVYVWYITGVNFGPGVQPVVYGSYTSPQATDGTTPFSFNTSGNAVIFVASTGGAVTTSIDMIVNPGAQIGNRYTLVGTSDTDSVTLQDTANFRPNGPVTLQADDAIDLLVVGLSPLQIIEAGRSS